MISIIWHNKKAGSDPAFIFLIVSPGNRLILLFHRTKAASACQDWRLLPRTLSVPDELLEKVPFLFVSELMFKAGPEVHGNRPDLDLHRHIFAAVKEKDGNGYDEMEASVTVFFRTAYVIFAVDEFYVILLKHHISHCIYVINKIAHTLIPAMSMMFSRADSMEISFP